jgi:hypothetical protein
MAGQKKGTNTGSANKPPKGTTNAEGGGGGGEGEEEEEEEEAGVTLEAVNKAIDARLSRFTKKVLPKALESSFAAALAKAGLTKPAGQEEEGEEEEEGEGGEGAEAAPANGAAKPPKGTAAAPAASAPQRSPGEDKKLKKLQKELAEMKASQDAERQKRLREEEVSLLSTTLPGLNVRSEMVAPLTTFLRSEDAGRLVRRNGEGKVVFVQKDDDGDEEEVALKDGLTKWLGTEAGKAYLSPKGAGGSGATGAGKPPAGRGGGDSAAELNNQLFSMLSGG